MKGNYRRYSLDYNKADTYQFETIVAVPTVGWCSFYSFRLASALTSSYTRGYRIVGKSFRFNMDVPHIEVFLEVKRFYK